MGIKSFIDGLPARMGGGIRRFSNNVRDSGWLFTFGEATSGERVNERTAMQITTVYACVRLLSESLASLPFQLRRRLEDGSELAREHPLYPVLHRQANPEMTSFTWRETTMTHLLLWGNAYSQILRNGHGDVVGLYPLLPERMEVDRDERGRIFYTYHAWTDESMGMRDRDVVFRRDEMLHIPGLGFNGLVGFSPIAMEKDALGTVIAVEKYGGKFFKNGAELKGVLEHPGVLKDPERLRKSWKESYEGVDNAHKVAILEEGMRYSPISMPPEQSQFLSTRMYGVEEICRIFRVPPHLVQDLSHATYSNIEEQGIDFARHTLQPWASRIEQAIVKDVLLEGERDEYFPEFNLDGLQRGNYGARWQAYSIARANGVFSANDIRKLENMNPIPEEEGGDKYLVNGSYVEVKNAGAAYGANMQAVMEQALAGGGEGAVEAPEEAPGEGQEGAGAGQPVVVPMIPGRG